MNVSLRPAKKISRLVGALQVRTYLMMASLRKETLLMMFQKPLKWVSR